MSRTVRTLTTTALALGISLSAGASLAHAQEMEHGRVRSAAKAVESNKIKTIEQTQAGMAGYIRA